MNDNHITINTEELPGAIPIGEITKEIKKKFPIPTVSGVSEDGTIIEMILKSETERTDVDRDP